MAASTVFPRMILVLGAGSEQDQALQTLLAEQQDPNSPEFHHWLTPDDFRQRFGPSEQDVAAVRAWLVQRGFSIDSVSRSRRWIEFSGTSQQVESTFRTQMRQYRVEGKLHLANASDISIPSALALVVRGILSLHDFRRAPQTARYFEVRRNASGELAPVDPSFTVSSQGQTYHYVTPGDFARIYNLAPLHHQGFDGTGRSIAIAGRAHIQLGDIHIFRQIFGLPVNDPTIIFNGPDPGYLSAGDEIESTLDLEWAGAVAPGADITLVVSPSTVTTDGIDLASAYIVDHDLADVVSVSYGECEQNLGPAENAFYSELWGQAAAQGISVVVSSGDNGAAGCDYANSSTAYAGANINGLGSTPYNTAVGGTEFRENGNDARYWAETNHSDLSSVLGYIPEEVWNESCAAVEPDPSCYGLWSGSGGVSKVYSKPPWQAGPGVPADGMRDIPDISWAAAGGHDGFLMCVAFGPCIATSTDTGPSLGQATVVGGTSVSAPAFAGLLAIINQKTGSRQGLPNPRLYQLAASQNASDCDSTSQIDPWMVSPCNFYDITFGNNNVPGLPGAQAAPGYDLATGLGSINAANLVTNWGGTPQTPTTTSLGLPKSTFQHGDSIQVSVSVAPTNGSGTPTGDVVLVSDKSGPVSTAHPLTSGSFSGTVSSLPGGTYNLTAHYAGDANFSASDSSSVAVTVAPENSSISLAAYTYFGSPTPVTTAPYGNFLYFHVEVSGLSGVHATGGTITLYDGSTQLGVIPVSTLGQAEFVTGGFSILGALACLTVGQHNITAEFSGDESLQPITSAPLGITIAKSASFVYFPNMSATTWPADQPLPLVVQLAPSGPILPTGTIQLLDNGSPIGSPLPALPPMDGARPTVNATITLTAGTHLINATYSGDSVYEAGDTSTSFGPMNINAVAPTGTTTETTVTGPTTLTLGSRTTYTIKVTSSDKTTPTGSITLMTADGFASFEQNLVSGSASAPFDTFLSGPAVLFAQYSGDSTHAASVSTPINVTVQKGTPLVTLSASSAFVATGKKVSLMALMQMPGLFSVGSVPGERVQFYDSLDGAAQQPIGPPVDMTLSATRTLTFLGNIAVTLPKGTHLITAQFLGDSNLNPATSNSATVTVADPGFQLSASSPSVAVSAGDSGGVTLTATPLGGFQASATTTCTGAPRHATCTISPSTLTLNGSAASATVTVKTLAPSSAQAALGKESGSNFVFAIAFTALFCVGLPRKRYPARAAGTALFVIVLAFSVLSCGGGSGTTPPPGSTRTASSTILSSASAKVAQGQPVTLTAKVTSSASTIGGSVAFYEDSNQIAQSVSVVNNQAQLQVPALDIGTHVFTAGYSGDSNNYPSNSSSWQQVVTGSTRIVVTVSAAGQTQTTGFELVVQ